MFESKITQFFLDSIPQLLGGLFALNGKPFTGMAERLGRFGCLFLKFFPVIVGVLKALELCAQVLGVGEHGFNACAIFLF